MKSKRIIKDRIEQRTADRKHARRRRRHEFRLAAKGLRASIQMEISKALIKSEGPNP